MQNMDTVLLDRILEVMNQEEKESVLSRLKTDPASYHAMLQKLDLKKDVSLEPESIEKLARRNYGGAAGVSAAVQGFLLDFVRFY